MTDNNTIAPHALKAIEQLESASGPADLGPAYSIAIREARRLRSHPVMTSIFALSVVAMFAAYSIRPGDDGWFGYIAITLALLALLGRWLLSRNNRRVASLKRVNEAIARWMHLVPAMRELPE